MQDSYGDLIKTYKTISKRLSTGRQQGDDYNRLVSLRHEIEKIENESDTILRLDSPTQILKLEDIKDCPAGPPCELCRIVYYN